MRINETITGIEGAATGQTATIRMPINRRYHMLKFFAAATDKTVAEIVESVEIYVNGRLQWNVSAAFLLNWAKLNNLTVPAGCLPLYFSEPQRASVMDEQVTAYDVFGADSFIVRVRFAPGLTALTFSGLMVYDAAQSKYDGKVVRQIVRRLPYNYGSGTTVDITNLPTDQRIQRLYLSGPVISRVKVKADSFPVHDAKSAENNALLADYHLDPSAFAYAFVADPNGQIFDGLKVTRDLVVTVENDGSAPVNGILETVAPDFV